MYPKQALAMRIEGSAAKRCQALFSGSLGKDGTWATQQVWNPQVANFLHTITREAAQETSVLRIDLIIACDSDGPQESMTCASDQCGLVTVLCKRLADNNGPLDPLSLSNAFAMACAARPPARQPLSHRCCLGLPAS